MPSYYISAPLEIINDSTEIFIFEEESVTLECNYIGFPAPSITWTFNDSIVSNDSSGVSIVNFKSENNGTSRLTRSNVSSDTIEGRYSRILINVINKANIIFTVTKKF